MLKAPWDVAPQNCGDGVDYAAWGQYVFTSVMKLYHAETDNKRTIMLGCSGSSHRANHRTPVWWTGDNFYDELATGVAEVRPPNHLRFWFFASRLHIL